MRFSTTCTFLLLASVALVSMTTASTQMPFDAVYNESPNAAFGDLPRIELPLEESDDATLQANSGYVESMIAAQNGKHVLLTHRDFPHMSLRIKRTGTKKASVSQMQDDPAASPLYNTSDPDAFCDPTVTSWSGYVDMIDGKSLFFYFFESRDNPDKDPVLLWLTGGPGCSSSLGLFMELGPCFIPERGGKVSHGPPINGTKWNPYSWNSHASIFFLDQPVEVGYSYSRYGLHTYNADQGAKDLYAFLRIFFSSFDRFQENEFVITGESYAGRYIPRYASEIVDRNHDISYAALRKDKKPKKGELINLKKVAIGNGLTDIAVQVPKYYDFVCTRAGGLEPVLDISTCKSMLTWKERCIKLYQEVCIDTWDPEQCAAVHDTCSAKLSDPYMDTGRNPYNAKDLCKVGYSPNLCYAVTEDIRNYLDREDVRELVGAEPISKIGEFKSCNTDVARGFEADHDATINNADYVAGLLERNVDVLIYVGKLDWICNWVGNKAWVDTFSWSDSETFHKADEYTWRVDGKQAGKTRKGGGLTWATVEEAGHMVSLAHSHHLLHTYLTHPPRHYRCLTISQRWRLLCSTASLTAISSRRQMSTIQAPSSVMIDQMCGDA